MYVYYSSAPIFDFGPAVTYKKHMIKKVISQDA